MTVLLTLTTAGTDSGPFDLYSNLDGFTDPFAINIPKATLVAGYSTVLVPEGTLTVRIKSVGDCVNYIDINLTNTTSSTSSTSTSTTTAAPTTSTTSSTTTPPAFRAWHFSSPGRASSAQACLNMNFSITWYTIWQTGNTLAGGSTLYYGSNLLNPVDGGNLWYQLQEAFIDIPTSYQVGTNGVIGPPVECS